MSKHCLLLAQKPDIFSCFYIKQKSQGKERKACFSFEDQGGLSEIKDKLFQCRGRLPALRGEQSFGECLGKENIMLMVRIQGLLNELKADLKLMDFKWTK